MTQGGTVCECVGDPLVMLLTRVKWVGKRQVVMLMRGYSMALKLDERLLKTC